MPSCDRRAARPALVLPLLLSALLGGCASSWQFFKAPVDRVAADLKADRYADALSVIDGTGKDDPQYGQLQQQRPGVIQASRAYRHDALARARQLAGQGHWRDAYDVLNDADDRVIDPKPVTALLDELHQRENTRLRDLLTAWYLAEARALLHTEQLDPALREHPGHRARLTLTQRRGLRARLTDDLTRLGNEYADRAQWQSAYKALEMAHRLSPDRQQPGALERARQSLDSARDRAEDARNQAHRKQARALIKRYQDSGHLEDLLAARTFLLQHQDEDLDDERDQVDGWCRQRFESEVASGDALYAQGRYRAAYRHWKRARPLDPDNVELNKKLERAAKVLHNLKTLSESDQ